MLSLAVAREVLFSRRCQLLLRGGFFVFMALAVSCSGKNSGFDPNVMLTAPIEPPLQLGCNPLHLRLRRVHRVEIRF